MVLISKKLTPGSSKYLPDWPKMNEKSVLPLFKHCTHHPTLSTIGGQYLLFLKKNQHFALRWKIVVRIVLESLLSRWVLTFHIWRVHYTHLRAIFVSYTSGWCCALNWAQILMTFWFLGIPSKSFSLCGVAVDKPWQVSFAIQQFQAKTLTSSIHVHLYAHSSYREHACLRGYLVVCRSSELATKILSGWQRATGRWWFEWAFVQWNLLMQLFSWALR